MKRNTYPPRFPKHATGIRAQVRGESPLTRNWWWQKWQKIVERIGIGIRLGKGKNYATSGQVTELKLSGSRVEAKVLGLRTSPYTVTLDFRTPNEEQRSRIVKNLREDPILVARLLAGELPMAVEDMFRAEGLELFPGEKLGDGEYDMTVKCSCPDWANPCKHSIAVLYILGEEVARRPLTLLGLRGIQAEELYES